MKWISSRGRVNRLCVLNWTLSCASGSEHRRVKDKLEEWDEKTRTVLEKKVETLEREKEGKMSSAGGLLDTRS